MRNELLYRYFEGEVTPQEMEEVKLWAEASSENKESFFKERKLYDAMLLNACAPTDSSIGNRKYRKNNIRAAARYLATACMAAALALFVFHRTSDDKEMAAWQTVTVPLGERANLELPDGTTVWLNTDTEMKYRSTYSTRSREVYINGEARFDVAKDEKNPFIVHTYIADIRVLGTNFNVEARKDSDIFETALFSGKVEVHPSDSEKAITLVPGYGLVLSDGIMKTREIEDSNPYRWYEGLICFKQERFADIVKSLEKYYNVEILIGRDDIQDVRFTGKFRIVDGVDYALRILQNDIPFDFKRQFDNNTIVIE